ncbi:glyoxalase/Bleomycin resistance protein/Dioxygenase superfamily protein [Colletotrichum graminicola]|uniref:Glyoxalase/Bleomycin resistance protein/Dioxygenase superfamily protein n=1 Tax=Colletotrichum graminicola (strain M1.001 / M2 / FGSC 10212) TaxID=645133 RepID=E3Q8Q0_COLGM|nr:glyoxalase/Bleomycin resistance protein/Dioxygenase superfamily protein [Colletotrichum graminicola M1.001]EFQ27414.1 glyoxalase/Bleomycin resistance protein/Dioxygenase superfamily protein [Colletotrichum graminicola M1.001]WDK13217.1 glyoxalase/Bleomycin resistance protein/Dioxygenase superfamily protein [Colletotrichum graminicola]
MALDTVPAPSEIAHLGFRSKNPEKLVDFYQRFLGARVQLANDFISLLAWDKEHHRLAIINDPSAAAKDEGGCGIDHIALKFASVGDLVKVYRAGKEAGITPFRCLNHGVSSSLYYKDPDGNHVEVMIEAYDNPEDVEKYMKTLDPMKIKLAKFDPEDLLRRVDAGEDEETLRRAGFIGPPPTALEC